MSAGKGSLIFSALHVAISLTETDFLNLMSLIGEGGTDDTWHAGGWDVVCGQLVSRGWSAQAWGVETGAAIVRTL